MSEDRKPKPPDLEEIERLCFDPLHGGDIFSLGMFNVRVGKPKAKSIKFYRAHPSREYHQRRLLLVTSEEEEFSGDEFYLVTPSMEPALAQFCKPFIIHTLMDRELSVLLWPVRVPQPDEEEHPAWTSARTAIRKAATAWTRIYWLKRKYQTLEAAAGYAPDPTEDDLRRIPSYGELLKTGFGAANTIDSKEHAVYREWFGAQKLQEADDDEELA